MSGVAGFAVYTHQRTAVAGIAASAIPVAIPAAMAEVASRSFA